MRAFGAVAGLAALSLWAGAADVDEDEGGKISVDGVRFDVLRGERLAYRIEAAKGVMSEETRQFHLESPAIQIFGKNEVDHDSLTGAVCEVWPEKVRAKDKKGKDTSISKFDWELTGGVVVDSSRGHSLKTERLRFKSDGNKLISPGKLAFKFPTGKGGSIEGSSDTFEAALDPFTMQMSGWALTGNIEFNFQAEEKKP